MKKQATSKDIWDSLDRLEEKSNKLEKIRDAKNKGMVENIKNEEEQSLKLEEAVQYALRKLTHIINRKEKFPFFHGDRAPNKDETIKLFNEVIDIAKETKNEITKISGREFGLKEPKTPLRNPLPVDLV